MFKNEVACVSVLTFVVTITKLITVTGEGHGFTAPSCTVLHCTVIYILTRNPHLLVSGSLSLEVVSLVTVLVSSAFHTLSLYASQ